MKDRLRAVERTLEEQGIRPEVRSAIRGEKICIIDDKITDLRSLVDGLEREGFTHLIEMQKVESIHHLVNAGYGLIILDLEGVAGDISDLDGIGVLSALKKSSPSLPILVVSGSATTANLVKEASKADAIRAKPIRSAELASEVDEILKIRCDPYWAGLVLLQKLRRLNKDIMPELRWHEKMRLMWHERRLLRDLERSKPAVSRRISTIGGLLVGLPDAAGIVTLIGTFISNE